MACNCKKFLDFGDKIMAAEDISLVTKAQKELPEEAEKDILYSVNVYGEKTVFLFGVPFESEEVRDKYFESYRKTLISSK